MKFFFDESGVFRVPTTAGQYVGIVSGVAIPDCVEAEVFKKFDEFVSTLPGSSFENGEPKGRLLGIASRNALADLLVSLPGILICPTMLDLTSLAGQPEADVGGLVSRKLLQLQATCKHDVFRNQILELADGVGKLHMQQALRLMAWAKCIARTLSDSIILHSGASYESSWNSLRFEIDRTGNPGNPEELVFEPMLPMWVSGWSQNEPFTLIDGVHNAHHPLVKHWNNNKGLDVGAMFSGHVHYVCSATSKGIQLADMTASLVRRAVIGIVTAKDLQNYGLMMTKAIGPPLKASGLFWLASVPISELERRYHGIADAINAARSAEPDSYCRP